jgi:hypothetical protein
MIDEQRKGLTLFLGECWHERAEIYKGLILVEVNYCRFCSADLFESRNRTFDTWQDYGDMKNKLVGAGLWDEFLKYSTLSLGVIALNQPVHLDDIVKDITHLIDPARIPLMWKFLVSVKQI